MPLVTIDLLEGPAPQGLDTIADAVDAAMVEHSSSSGRAIAAFNPTAARSMFEAGLIRRTRDTVVDPRQLDEILAETRHRGYTPLSTVEPRV